MAGLESFGMYFLGARTVCYYLHATMTVNSENNNDGSSKSHGFLPMAPIQTIYFVPILIVLSMTRLTEHRNEAGILKVEATSDLPLDSGTDLE